MAHVWVCYSLPVFSWVSYRTSPCHNFLACKMKIMTVPTSFYVVVMINLLNVHGLDRVSNIVKSPTDIS